MNKNFTKFNKNEKLLDLTSVVSKKPEELRLLTLAGPSVFFPKSLLIRNYSLGFIKG